jgi:gliding motility-associated-like protein
MMRKVVFLSTILVSMFYTLSAQQKCTTDERRNEKMGDANYKVQYDDFNRTLSRASGRRRNSRLLASGTVYTIPVVIHVLHKGEPVGSGVNISDEQIYAALKELNERFRKVPGSVGDGNSVDMEYQFALAVRDPDGNCTNGINRIDMSGYQNYMDYGNHSLGMDDGTIKSISYWDANYYCNIWIVSDIEGAGGYSSFPHEHGSSGDGIVIRYNALDIAPTYQALTHELGHYVGLEHVFHWGNTEVCPPNDDCLNQGDGVCDTPPQLQEASCELSPNPCEPGEYVAAVNYMSYSCMSEFTAGQRDRSRIAFDYYRTSLLEENGNMALVPVGSFTANFTRATQGSCITAGSDIQLFDRTSCIHNTFINSNQNTSFDWLLTNNDGETLTSTDRNPVFNFSEAGNYDVTLAVTTPNGTNTTTKNNFLVVGGTMPTTNCFVRTLGVTRPGFDGIGIYEVILSDMHHSSGSTIEDVRNAVTDRNGYGDFSCTYSASLEPFADYTVSVKLAEYYQESVYVYIDFDNNGLTNEDLVTFSDVPLGSGVFALPSFRTPVFQIFNTPLRMRVIDVDSSEPPPPDPCGDVGYYGQIQDYSVIFNNVFPLAGDDAATIDEDGVALVDVTSNDVDPDGTILGFTVDLDPTADNLQQYITTAEGTWRLIGANKIEFRPVSNFNGTTTIEYAISDNRFAPSLPAKITVTVHPVNDAPEFLKGANEIVMEDADVQSIEDWAIGISSGPADEISQALTFTVTNDNNTLFSVQPSINAGGQLTYAPAENAFGFATVSVVLKDDGGTDNAGTDTGATQIFIITVNGVNDPPSFTKGPDLTVNENSGPQSEENWAMSISAGPGEDAFQTLSFNISNDDNAIFAVQPSINVNGKITYTPATNASGFATVIVALQDNGGTDNDGVDLSTSQTFTITINAVNNAPSFTKGLDEIVNEDAGSQTVANWSTAISAGPADEFSQALIFNVTNDNNALFSVQPSIDVNGDLTYTPSTNASGIATISVVLQDDGGTDNDGIDLSTGQTFTITVNAVNDSPSFTKGNDQVVNEDAGTQIASSWATSISAGPTDEVSQTLTFDLTNDNNALFAEQPSINVNGDLRYTPAANIAGSATVTVVLKDDGETGNSGIDAVTEIFTITVNSVNDSPILANVSFSTDEDIEVAGNIFYASDNDPEGTALIVNPTPVTNPAHGTIVINNDGSFVFTPSANFFGSDAATISVCDSSDPASCSTKTITLIINSINDAPVIADYATVTTRGMSVSQDFTAGDSDVDGTISYKTTPVSGPEHGEIIINTDGTFTYTPDENYTGTDVVVIEACDDGTPVLCSEKLLTIEIQQVAGVSPIAINDEITVTQGEDIVIDLLANDTDEDNDIDPASVDLDVSTIGIQQSVSLDRQGTGTVTDDGVLSFLADVDFSGMVELSYTIKDNQGNLSNAAIIRITIDAILPQDVAIPNGFTPNGDGQNDLFTIGGTDQYQVRLSVYNRWGNVVFEDANYRNTWNGTFRNETKVPDGTYFYTVEFAGSADKRYQGFIEIRR